MTAQIRTGSGIVVRITTEVPEGVDCEAYAEQLRAKGNPVIRALPDERRVLLAELVRQTPSRIKRAFNKLKRLG